MKKCASYGGYEVPNLEELAITCVIQKLESIRNEQDLISCWKHIPWGALHNQAWEVTADTWKGEGGMEDCTWNWGADHTQCSSCGAYLLHLFPKDSNSSTWNASSNCTGICFWHRISNLSKTIVESLRVHMYYRTGKEPSFSCFNTKTSCSSLCLHSDGWHLVQDNFCKLLVLERHKRTPM